MNIYHSPAATESRTHHAASHQKPGWLHPVKKDALRSSIIAGWWPREACLSLEKLVK